jgi:hypothetical protein
MTQAQTAASQGYVLGATEGEHLVHWRGAGNIFIKVGPATGSDDLALGPQQVPVGAGIPTSEQLSGHIRKGKGGPTTTTVHVSQRPHGRNPVDSFLGSAFPRLKPQSLRLGRVHIWLDCP